MNERRQQDTLEQEEYETCEHGIHIDSGHECWECAVNDGDAEIYEGESDECSSLR